MRRLATAEGIYKIIYSRPFYLLKNNEYLPAVKENKLRLSKFVYAISVKTLSVLEIGLF